MNDESALAGDYARRHPDAFARDLGRGSTEEIHDLLQQLGPRAAATVVARLPSHKVRALYESDQGIAVNWLQAAPLEDAARLLGHIRREQCLAIVNAIENRERRRWFLQYLNYPAHSVGSLVVDVPLKIHADTAAADVLQELRALSGADPGPIAVVSGTGSYLGKLDLWALLVSPSPAGRIRDFVRPTPTLAPEVSLQNSVQNVGWRDHNWLPVVDYQNRLLGGIDRASLLAVTDTDPYSASRLDNPLTTLFADLVRLFGDLLDIVLARRPRNES